MHQENLNVFISNRLEILAEKLSVIVQSPLPTPLATEIIVVQSRGMQRWVSMELARLNGICGNCDFPFPNSFIDDIFEKLMPDLPDTSSFDPGVLTFRIMNVLPGCLYKSGFNSLQGYLADDRHRLKLYQLSAKIADLFDQYLVFRPEMIFQWEAGKEDQNTPYAWQAELWRQVTRGLPGLHRARLRKKFLERVEHSRLDAGRLPGRISIFGISYLPLFHLQAFAALSRQVPTHFFLLNPCREYWADIVSERELQKTRQKDPRVAENISWYHFEKGNRLLASMGALGRNFFEVISELDCEIHEQFEAPQRSSLLGAIQSDIFHLTDGRYFPDESSSSDLPPPPLRPQLILETTAPGAGDTSVQVHNCHSPMREIEVLHDHLLAMFEEDPQLLPKDIIVMIPDIGTYAPFIQAVFDGQTDEAQRIPYSIADRSPRLENRAVDGFLALLKLRDSRFEAARVFALLEFPGIKERFGLGESDLPLIESWIKDTHIRWGVDKDSRVRLGLPGFSQNTWQAGLQRLLLGYAMAGKNRKIFSGIVPHDNVEGGEARVLGRFIEFVDRLFEWAALLDVSRKLDAWRQTLLALIDNFFQSDDDIERELQLLRQLLEDLADKQLRADFQQKVEPEIVTTFLKTRLDQSIYGSGFLTGGVTFCAMLPMRSIPFKIICLAGMNNDAFPRDFQSLNFDLIARYPRAGDRSRRNDDKYLFLESILSARNKLYISYVGQSIQDNSPIPPSVLVSELLEVIENNRAISAQPASESIITIHRLQHFSPWYFREDSPLFSYSTPDLVALAGIEGKKDPPPFITGPLSMAAEEIAAWQKPDIEDLCRLFSNPARFFLQQRLGVWLEDTDSQIEECETFALNSLEKYRVEHNLLETRFFGVSSEIIDAIQQALGQLPQGSIGDYQYQQMDIAVQEFVERFKHFTGDTISNSIEVADLEIGGFHLKGRLPGIFSRGLVDMRYGKRRGQDLLRCWIRHVFLSHATVSTDPPLSFLLCTDSVTEFDRVADSEKILGQLLGLFRLGLEQPLHFFPKSSFEYAEQLLNRSAIRQTALSRARKTWAGGDFAEYTTPESANAYYDLCFRHSEPLDETFEEIAMTIFKPLLAHCREIGV